MVADLSPKDYKVIVAGFGDTADKAQEDAESRLPFDPSEKDDYCTKYGTGDPREVEGGQLKIEIGYNLRQTKSKSKKTKAKSSSYGLGDVFDVTRNLEDRV